MTNAELILELRKEVGDVKKTVAANWTGDGTTKVFLLPLLTFPVLESSYTITVAGAGLTETTEFTIDRESGRIDLVSAPTNGQAVQFIGLRVALTDESWLEIIRDTVRAMGDDFWKEVTDIASYTTTANMLEKDISAGNWVAIYDVYRRIASTSNFEIVTNWRFSPDEGKLFFGDRDEFDTTGQALKVRGLKKYTLPTTTAGTFDVQDRYLTIVKYGAVARYWRYKMREVVETLSKVTQESTRTQLQEFIMLIDRYERWYERDFARLKPAKPARFIPKYIPGKPRP